jgi:hypothetical protein
MPHHWDSMDGRRVTTFKILCWLVSIYHGRGRYYGADAQLMHMGWARHNGAWCRQPHLPGSSRADPRRPVQVTAGPGRSRTDCPGCR